MKEGVKSLILDAKTLYGADTSKGKRNFYTWLWKQQKIEQFRIEKALNIDIFRLTGMDVLETIFLYLPANLVYVKNNMEYHFDFRISMINNTKTKSYSIGYYLYMSQSTNQNIGGYTTVWANPFQKGQIGNHLIELNNLAVGDSIENAVKKMYEFLILKEIIK